MTPSGSTVARADRALHVLDFCEYTLQFTLDMISLQSTEITQISKAHCGIPVCRLHVTTLSICEILRGNLPTNIITNQEEAIVCLISFDVKVLLFVLLLQ